MSNNSVAGICSSIRRLNHNDTSVILVDCKWEDVQRYVLISFFLLASVFAKLIFNSTPGMFKRFPESFLLIVVGCLFGFVLFIGMYSTCVL